MVSYVIPSASFPGGPELLSARSRQLQFREATADSGGRIWLDLDRTAKQNCVPEAEPTVT